MTRASMLQGARVVRLEARTPLRGHCFKTVQNTRKEYNTINMRRDSNQRHALMHPWATGPHSLPPLPPSFPLFPPPKLTVALALSRSLSRSRSLFLSLSLPPVLPLPLSSVGERRCMRRHAQAIHLRFAAPQPRLGRRRLLLILLHHALQSS